MARDEFRHVVELIGGAAIAAAMTMIYTVVAGRLLGPAEYGDFAACLSLIYITATAAGPISPTVAKFCAGLPEGHIGQARALRRATFSLVSSWGAAGVLIGLITVTPLSRLLHLRARLPLALSLIVVFLFLVVSVDRGLYQGLRRFRRYNLNMILEASLRMAIGLTAIYFYRAAAAGLAGYLAALAIATLVIAAQIRVDLPNSDEPFDRGRLLKFLKPMLLLSLGIAIYQNLDMIAAKAFFSAPTAGMYGAAYSLTRVIGVVLAPIYVLALPVMVPVATNRRELSVALGRLCGYFLLCSLPLLLIFRMLPSQVIERTYGHSYADAAGLLFPLAVAVVFGYLSLLITQAFAARGQFRFLWLYLAGTALEGAMLMAFRGSPASIVSALIVSQIVIFTAMALWFFLSPGSVVPEDRA